MALDINSEHSHIYSKQASRRQALGKNSSFNIKLLSNLELRRFNGKVHFNESLIGRSELHKKSEPHRKIEASSKNRSLIGKLERGFIASAEMRTLALQCFSGNSEHYWKIGFCEKSELGGSAEIQSFKASLGQINCRMSRASSFLLGKLPFRRLVIDFQKLRR